MCKVIFGHILVTTNMSIDINEAIIIYSEDHITNMPYWLGHAEVSYRNECPLRVKLTSINIFSVISQAKFFFVSHHNYPDIYLSKHWTEHSECQIAWLKVAWGTSPAEEVSLPRVSLVFAVHFAVVHVLMDHNTHHGTNYNNRPLAQGHITHSTQDSSKHPNKNPLPEVEVHLAEGKSPEKDELGQMTNSYTTAHDQRK